MTARSRAVGTVYIGIKKAFVGIEISSDYVCPIPSNVSMVTAF